MTKTAKAIAKDHKTLVLQPGPHECFMDVLDLVALLDNANDLVSFPKRWPSENSVPSSVQLRFMEGGELSTLQVWSANGERFFGELSGHELFMYIGRIVARMDDHTPSNSPSMRGPATNPSPSGLTVIRGGRV
jgi:hypothetical protein